MTKKHSERFKDLMSRSEKVDEYFYFTEEEILFLAKEDLPTFGEKFPDEAEYYMQILS